MTTLSKAQKKFVDTLLSSLQKDIIPWQTTWDQSICKPVNGITNRVYRGVNLINLYTQSVIHGYDDPRWMTFKQANEAGYRIKAGSSGIEIYKYALKDETGKVLGKAEYDKLDSAEKENVKFVSKSYTVFNARQITGIPALEKQQSVRFNDEKAKVFCETLKRNMNIKIEHGGVRAFYNPSYDLIQLPSEDTFISEQSYYATRLHESAHATSHASRLNRAISTQKNSKEYAIEELRAEMTSVFMSLDMGYHFDQFHEQNHQAYIQAWIKTLQDDPGVIFRAISDAQKIQSYLFEKGEYDKIYNMEADVEYAQTKEKENVSQQMDEESINLQNRPIDDYQQQAADVKLDIAEMEKRVLELNNQIAAKKIELNRINDQLEAAAAPGSPDTMIQPIVTIDWSESRELSSDQKMTFFEAENILKQLNHDYEQEKGYAKTDFHIDATFQGEPFSYEGRIDLGDGDGGGLIDHIKASAQDVSMLSYVDEEKREQMKEQQDFILTDIIPYLQQHYHLSQLEQSSSKVQNPDYDIAKFRELVNQGKYLHTTIDPLVAINNDLASSVAATPDVSLTKMSNIDMGGIRADDISWEFSGGKVEANTENNRLQIFFDEKPNEAIRTELKSNGFRWAPKVAVWQRPLTDQAIQAAKCIDILKPSEHVEPRKEATLEQMKAAVGIAEYARDILGMGLVKESHGLIRLEEHDSCKIYPNNTFYRFSRGVGGSIIDFIKHFEEADTKAAIEKIKEYYLSHGLTPNTNQSSVNYHHEIRGLEVPEKADTNKHVYAYLTQKRGISPSVVKEYFDRKILYEDTNRNCVFCGKYDNTIYYANLRGTGNKAFKMDASGSTKEVGVYVDNGATTLVVNEAVIDQMSYMSLLEDPHAYNYLSVCGAANAVSAVAFHMQKRKSEVQKLKRIIIGLDNDKAGEENTIKVIDYLHENYPDLETLVHIPNEKDFNEQLQKELDVLSSTAPSQEPAMIPN